MQFIVLHTSVHVMSDTRRNAGKVKLPQLWQKNDHYIFWAASWILVLFGTKFNDP